MPPTKIFGWAALCFSETATFELEGLWANFCFHLGEKLEVIGLKASWANALCSSPILVASATNVSCADLAYSVVSSTNLSGDFTPASFSKYALFASNDDLAKSVWAVVIVLANPSDADPTVSIRH